MDFRDLAAGQSAPGWRELAGGLDASVRHVRCAPEGDAFCEWELRWR